MVGSTRRVERHGWRRLSGILHVPPDAGVIFTWLRMRGYINFSGE
jgi:hypothetical protein